MQRPTIRATRVLCGLLLVLPSVATVADDAGVARVDSDTDRVPLHTIIPEYPRIARRDRIEGEVQVCFEITRDGYTRRIAVRHSTHRLFEKPAIRAVRRSSFRPLPAGAELPSIKACRTFRFSLQPVDANDDT